MCVCISTLVCVRSVVVGQLLLGMSTDDVVAPTFAGEDEAPMDGSIIPDELRETQAQSPVFNLDSVAGPEIQAEGTNLREFLDSAFAIYLEQTDGGRKFLTVSNCNPPNTHLKTTQQVFGIPLIENAPPLSVSEQAAVARAYATNQWYKGKPLHRLLPRLIFPILDAKYDFVFDTGLRYDSYAKHCIEMKFGPSVVVAIYKAVKMLKKTRLFPKGYLKTTISARMVNKMILPYLAEYRKPEDQ